MSVVRGKHQPVLDGVGLKGRFIGEYCGYNIQGRCSKRERRMLGQSPLLNLEKLERGSSFSPAIARWSFQLPGELFFNTETLSFWVFVVLASPRDVCAPEGESLS